MNQRKIVYLFISTLSIFIMLGCSSEQPKYESNQITNISNSKSNNQQHANEAKQFLSGYNEDSRIQAVNHDKDLHIAVDVNHENLFQLDELGKNLGEKVEIQFNILDVT